MTTKVKAKEAISGATWGPVACAPNKAVSLHSGVRSRRTFLDGNEQRSASGPNVLCKPTVLTNDSR